MFVKRFFASLRMTKGKAKNDIGKEILRCAQNDKRGNAQNDKRDGDSSSLRSSE